MSPTRRRGQPLAGLGIVLLGWIALRVAAWEPPFAIDAARALALAPSTRTPAPNPLPGIAEALPTPPVVIALRPPRKMDAQGLVLRATAKPLLPLPVGVELAAEPPAAAAAAAAATMLIPPAADRASSPGLVRVPRAIVVGRPRFSGDGWLLARGGGSGLGAGAGNPAYGASQMGGVLRYALAPASRLAPQAFVRVSRSLGDLAESEAAVGLAVRPLADVPLRLAGEARLRRSGGMTRLRPAATLITELAPQRLPLNIDAEAYAQAGYVGGRGATPFFDAQLTAERTLTVLGPTTVHLGGGAWAGGQDGASRLDIGPRAGIRFSAGGTASRLALDWRFRVTGRARPASGPALTFSAGF